MTVLAACGREDNAEQGSLPSSDATDAADSTSVPTSSSLLDDRVASSVFLESFEDTAELPEVNWSRDTFSYHGPFSESGEFFTQRNINPPEAYRAQLSFGESGWLTAELYSRSSTKPLSSFLSIVEDPEYKQGSSNSGETINRVLRLASEEHTDAVVIRSTNPLPAEFRLSMRVGFADYGNGDGVQNGYDSGTENAGPWVNGPAIGENGFYWFALLDTVPKPHNNIWIHHHRKFVIDSDNNAGAWMQVWDGAGWVPGGQNPVMVFALDGRGKSRIKHGNPFISYAADKWQDSGDIKAVDQYLPAQWYNVEFSRIAGHYQVRLQGLFKNGGNTSYEASMDYSENCLWHHNRSPGELNEECVSNDYFPQLGPAHPFWSSDSAFPDYFMFGDPHINYYEGEVYFDNIQLDILE